MAVTYTTLTVGRSGGPAFTVGRSITAAAFTVQGHPGALVGYTPPAVTVDLAFLTEAGDFLLLETGDYLITEAGSTSAAVDLAFLTEANDALTAETGDYLLTT